MLSTQSLELIKSIMLVIALFSSVRVAFVRHIVKNVIINSLAFAKGARNVALTDDWPLFAMLQMNTLKTSTRKCVMVSTYAHFTLLQTVSNRRLVTYRSIPTKEIRLLLFSELQRRIDLNNCFLAILSNLAHHFAHIGASAVAEFTAQPFVWPRLCLVCLIYGSESDQRKQTSANVRRTTAKIIPYKAT